MDKKFIEKLKRIKEEDGRFKPDRVWVSETREKLMSQIANTVSKETQDEKRFELRDAFAWVSILAPKRFLVAMRPVAITVMAMIVAGSGWIISVKASNSLPGDYLWNVKLAGEKVQMAVTTKDEKPKKHFEFASRRLEEAKKVKQSDKTEKAGENISKAIKSAKKSVESAKKSVDSSDTKSKKPQEAVADAKEVNEKAEEITESIKELKKEVEEVVEENTVKEMLETTKIVSDVSVKVIEQAVEVVEGNKLEKDALTQEEMDIRELVSEKAEKLNEMLRSAGSAENKEENNKEWDGEEGVESGEKEVKNSNVDTTSSTTEITISTSTEEVGGVTTTSKEIDPNDLDLDEVVQKAEEVKQKIGDSNVTLKEAVENLKVLTETTSIVLDAVETNKKENISTEAGDVEQNTGEEVGGDENTEGVDSTDSSTTTLE